MTVVAPGPGFITIFPAIGKALGGSAELAAPIQAGLRTALADLQAKRAARTGPSVPDRTPPAAAALPVVVSPVVAGVSTFLPARYSLGAAFLTGYGVGSAFWKAFGTPILDRVMPKYDPNAPATYYASSTINTIRMQQALARQAAAGTIPSSKRGAAPQPSPP